MADAHVVVDLSALDREALQALVLAQQEKLLGRDSEIEHLRLVAKLRLMMFGTTSEKVARKIEQPETRQAEHAEARAASTLPRNKPTRRPLPEHLPCEVHM